jgi:hypothetical protein
MKPRLNGRRAQTDLRSYHLAAIAVYLAGGADKAVHTEDAAIKAFELAPHRFSWKKYPEKIDLEAVRVALRHAGEQQYGELVKGSIETGWMLTPAGLAFAEAAASQLEARTTTQARRGSRQAAMDAERERLFQTAAWRKFQQVGLDDISVHDFHSFARVNEYTSRQKYEERIGILRIATQMQPELAALVDALDKRFGGEYRN